MSKDKYPAYFRPKWRLSCLLSFKSFFATHPVLKTGEYINNSLHLARKYARIFVRGQLLFREVNSFRDRSSRKTVSFEEQIGSKDKYPSIFSPQMETIVFIILQNRAEYRLILSRRGRRPSRLKSDDIPQD